MSDNNGRLFLREKDFVEVVDADGTPLPPVPKHWGKDQLALGAEFKRKAGSSSRSTGTSGSGTSGSGTSGSGTPDNLGGGSTPSPEEPNGNASTEAWVAFAKTQGAKDEDLVDGDGKPLSRDDIRAKYGTSKDENPS